MCEALIRDAEPHHESDDPIVRLTPPLTREWQPCPTPNLRSFAAQRIRFGRIDEGRAT
jgi:hypothetical protein